MNQRDKKPIITMLPDFGKCPPQANDMEVAVLGIILTYSESFNDIADILTPEMFYREAHQKIFESCQNVFKKISSVDLITVTNDLRDNKNLDLIGGPVYITSLCNTTATIGMIENYALIVKQKYVQREYIRVGNEIQSRAFDDTYDVSEVAEYAEMELLEISGKIHRKEPKLLARLIDGVIDIIQKIINREITLIGIPSGFTKLDRVTGGFKRGELTIIAGRPGMGKTALALQIAKNAAELKNPIGFFSCEMSDESLARRYLSNVSGKTNVELLTGKCEIEKLLRDSEQLLKLGIYIDDTSHLSILELRAKSRKLILRYGINMIVIDYLQLMRGEGQNRETEVSSISRGLKSIAKDLDIPVIALSQINRESESTRDKKPGLSQLRESGAIEQDADMVILLYRPAYYKIDTCTSNNIDISTAGLLIADIAKNRNGATGEFNLKHNESLTNIYEEDEFKANIPPEFTPIDDIDRPF
jgi:replicative DNA helicase